jgi:hypothetical protein
MLPVTNSPYRRPSPDRKSGVLPADKRGGRGYRPRPPVFFHEAALSGPLIATIHDQFMSCVY